MLVRLHSPHEIVSVSNVNKRVGPIEIYLLLPWRFSSWMWNCIPYRDLQYVAMSKLYEVIEPLLRTSGVKEPLDTFYDVAINLFFLEYLESDTAPLERTYTNHTRCKLAVWAMSLLVRKEAPSYKNWFIFSYNAHDSKNELTRDMLCQIRNDTRDTWFDFGRGMGHLDRCFP
jgi:hypothetical protein